jgi:hypothetical protein
LGLYNGRYGLSNMVLIDKIAPEQRPLAEKMLDGELARQRQLKDVLAQDPVSSAWIENLYLLQNYKQLQFFDTLALYFNRVHRSERGELKFDHVPLNERDDVTVTVRPAGDGVYSLSPFPFRPEGASFAFAGRPVSPGGYDTKGHWTIALATAPTVWESFRLVAA